MRQDRRDYYKTVRFQQLLFSFAQLIVEDLVAGAQNDGGEAAKRGVLARHLIFPEVLRIVTQYVDRKVKYAPGVDRRELAVRNTSGFSAKGCGTGFFPRQLGTMLRFFLSLTRISHP